MDPMIGDHDSVANDRRTSVRAGFAEILDALLFAHQWSTLAWSDIRLRYRRTTLGPLWITLGLGATVFSVGFVYGTLFGNPMSQYLPYFTAGLIAWTLIVTSLTEGCAAFLGAAAIIKSIPVAPAVHVWRMMARQIIILFHNLVLVVILWLVFRWHLSWATLLVVPAFLLNAVALFGAVLALSIVAARFRDIQLIVTTILQLVFLLTPIMWQPRTVPNAAIAYLVELNPFFHFIEIVRRPMLGQSPTLLSWLYCCVFTALCMYVGIYFYARYRHRIAFWV